MSRTKIINYTLLAVFLCGCTQFEPVVDRRREAGAKDAAHLWVGQSTPQRPAVCYNSLYTSYAEVKKLADETCIKEKTGTHAVPDRQTYFSCRLLMPNHFYFTCKK